MMQTKYIFARTRRDREKVMEDRKERSKERQKGRLKEIRIKIERDRKEKKDQQVIILPSIHNSDHYIK